MHVRLETDSTLFVITSGVNTRALSLNVNNLPNKSMSSSTMSCCLRGASIKVLGREGAYVLKGVVPADPTYMACDLAIFLEITILETGHSLTPSLNQH